MGKKETIKFIVQIIASVATAIVTALGATSCMGMQQKKKACHCGRPLFITQQVINYNVQPFLYAISRYVGR